MELGVSNNLSRLNKNQGNTFVNKNNYFPPTSLNFYVSLNKILTNSENYNNENIQNLECDLIIPSPYFIDETLINTVKNKTQKFSIYS